LPDAPWPDAPLPDAPLPDRLGAGADLAGLVLAVFARAAPEPRAQPADAPSDAGPLRGGSGSGGADRLAPLPASGHCLPRPEAAPPVPTPLPPWLASAA
jgi:hypothetical protein